MVAVLGPAIHEDQHRSSVEIRRFELDVAPTALVAVGDVLLATGRAGERPSDDPRVWSALLRSTDLGRTWESLTLPGAAPGITYVVHGAGLVDELYLRTVVPRDAGGWLAVAAVDPPGDSRRTCCSPRTTACAGAVSRRAAPVRPRRYGTTPTSSSRRQSCPAVVRH
jgi:hypothetical protein